MNDYITQDVSISRRTRLLILLLSLLINSTFILVILNSQSPILPPQARVIPLDEQVATSPAQFMSSPSPSAPLASAQTQPIQQSPTPSVPQQDFEWVSGSAGFGKPGTTPENNAPPHLPVQQENHSEEQDNDDIMPDNGTEEIIQDEILSEPNQNETMHSSFVVSDEYKIPASSIPKKATSTTRQSSLPSLAQLTKQFIQQVADNSMGNGSGGGHSIGVQGGKQGIVSEKQLTYERYLKKLLNCLSTSAKIHKRSVPFSEQKQQAAVQFSLSRNGSYSSLYLVQSSGSPVVDDAILLIFNDAASSFPPIPQSLSEPFVSPAFILNSIADLLMPAGWSVRAGGM
jgi:hypothetical protein